MLSDGKVILHITNDNGPDQTILRKYNTDGSVDSSFGVGGACTVSNGYPGCLLLNDGKILLIEYEYSNNTIIIPPQIHMARLNANGTPDSSFGTNGVKIISNMPIPKSSYYSSFFISQDGHITILNQKQYIYQNQGRYLPLVIRLKPDLTLDETYSGDGIFIPEELDYSTLYGSTASVLLDDGSLIVSLGAYDDNKIIKITPGGTLDLTFGVGGIKQLPYSFGRIIKVNNNKFWTSSYSNTISRYNSDFTLDTTFGTNGSVPGSLGKTRLQSDNKVVSLETIGSSGFVTTYSTTIKRYNENGTLDISRSFRFQGDYDYEKGNDVQIQPDGKVLVSGGYVYSVYSMPSYAPVLARIMPDLNLLGNTDFNADLDDVKVYPNPFHDSFNLTLDLKDNKNISADLYDIQGRLMQRLFEKESFGVGINNKSISIPDQLSKGYYFINLTSESGIVKTIKIIKE
jgi:uncharacterized delta-60 repeat protein